MDTATGVRVGFALVEFESEEVAKEVIEHYSGRPIPGTDGLVFNLKTNYWTGNTTPSAADERDDFTIEAMENEHPLEPPLHVQLEPLSMSQLRERLTTFGCEFSSLERRAMLAGGRVAKKAELIRLLCKYHCSPIGRELSLRRRVFAEGEPVPEMLLLPLLQCLRSTQWTPRTRNVTAEEYIVVGVPAANAAPKNTEKYPELWRLTGLLMQTMAPTFEYSSVAITRNFTGSPHVDMGDRCWQYAVSLGDFNCGGELCVETGPTEVCVINTHNRLARMDGRFPHWVRSFTGERFSLIFYRITGPFVAPVQAVYSSL
jgi:hypothetical protein